MNGKLTNKQLMRELRQLVWGDEQPPKNSVLHQALEFIIGEIEKRLTRVR